MSANPSRIIPVYTRLACGVPRTYAADKSQAEALRKLTGSKALSDEQLSGLHALGFTTPEVADPQPKAFYSRKQRGGEDAGEISAGNTAQA